MANRVENLAPETVPKQPVFRRTRALLCKALGHLSVVVFLASLTLVLDHFKVFRPFDDDVLAFALSLTGRDLEALPHPHLTTLLVSPQMFERELGRSLPVNRDKLAELLTRERLNKSTDLTARR